MEKVCSFRKIGAGQFPAQCENPAVAQVKTTVKGDWCNICLAHLLKRLKAQAETAKFTGISTELRDLSVG